MRGWCLAAALAVAVALAPGQACAQADVALVLAVDVSGSVNEARFKLQREGIAGALDSEGFERAILGGIHQTVEIAVVEWAEEQEVIVPWTVVHGRSELAKLALQVRQANRAWVHTKTDAGGGIAAAARLFADAPLTAERQVIDVSGDGQQNCGEIPATEARDAAVAMGITVNGLPITSGDEPHVDDWYRTNIVGGPRSFLIVADGYEAFAEAFRQKLTLEVARSVPKGLLAYVP